MCMDIKRGSVGISSNRVNACSYIERISVGVRIIIGPIMIIGTPFTPAFTAISLIALLAVM